RVRGRLFRAGAARARAIRGARVFGGGFGGPFHAAEGEGGGLAGGAGALGGLGLAEGGVDDVVDLAAVPSGGGEGAGLVEAFDEALVDEAGVEAGAEVEDVAVGSVGGAVFDDGAGGPLPHVLDGAESEADVAVL